MSELCAPSRLISLSLHIFFYLLSHPLYFSYLIFFSPYLLTLLSFLFPLLAAVFLLLLALYTLSPPLFCLENFDDSDFTEPKAGFFFSFQHFFDDFEAFKYEEAEIPDDVPVETCEDKAEISPAGNSPPLIKDVEEDQQPENTQNSEFKKIEEQKTKLFVQENPNEAEDNINSGSGPSVLSISGGSGSMRKEREWRRTLACKLYEERHKVEEGSEGMDSLWETYEIESNTAEKKRRSSSRKSKKGGFEESRKEDQNVEDEDSTGVVCCLQAFKLSTGKMNLGMGRSNLVKLSKVLAGIGWFHQVKIKHVRKCSS